ncbi:MAG TPA: ABC transporter ATP-binding protein [Pseudomonadales bacterium]
MSVQPLLRISSLSVRLPRTGERAYAVEDVSLTLARNEVLCVVGESGSGKSIMAKTVMGLLPRRLAVAGGSVNFEGRELLELSEPQRRAMRGREMGMIFQEPMSALNPLHTIGNQIDEVLRVHAATKRARRRQTVLEVLDAVKLPDPQRIFHAYPHQLSGGQRQRAMIAMALIMKPDLIIADEPTTALDVTTQAEILELIKTLQAERSTGVLFITHDIGVVAEIADRVVVMKDGRMVESGTCENILRHPQADYTRMLITAVPSLKPATRPAAADEQEVALSIERVVKTYHAGGLLTGSRVVRAVDDVTLEVRRGQTLGIVGESGSGKSTLARCVIRLIDPDSGHIRYAGFDLATLKRAGMLPLRKRIQMVFQDPYGSLNPRLTVVRMIAQGPVLHGTPPEQARERALELLSLVGLDASAASRYPHEFSGGQRQRIGIARALALEPEILVADEPVSALDVSVQAQVLKLLASIRERFQLTMIFVTHDLRVAAQVCDTLAVMQLGRVVEHGTTRDVFTAPAHDYTRRLLSAIPGRQFDDVLAT